MEKKEKKEKQCQVCEQKPAKYKCPYCRTIKYCGIECFQKHKNSHEDGEIYGKYYESEFKGYPKSQILDEEEDGPILSLDQLQALESDENLKQMLKNKDLRQILEEIDTASNRQKKLNYIKRQDKTGSSLFTSLINQMLETTGYLKDGKFLG